jgi:hypothetical protein
LGYTLPAEEASEWHLVQHPPSEVDAQEPDGALGFFTKDEKLPKAVIELKDAKTPLDKKQSGREKGYTPIEQAYLYATKFDRCNWIIVSNFREIRLYNSIIIGGIVGESVDLEKYLETFSNFLKSKIRSKNEHFAHGLITAFLIYCVGSMTFIGTLNEGLREDGRFSSRSPY